ncbi:SDR family NAD(P)-dependent oxidoreductase [Bacillus cereus]|uniref:SDR family NAD(P)-dependent oxidoreductase n=1 Tax=Bacillus cereus TaxID=1396 RepID=UPI0018A7C5EB|nr:SDR family NAD(P)-dependent oxidoreductase [Bacillus cereus]MBF8116593.1 SDR family NAD(P)-dependent oxidoreductase [Bacillus cereus]MCB5904040.1 SDR family NAD(P)-dependent oxidoreductase [Bacillus cereus]
MDKKSLFSENIGIVDFNFEDNIESSSTSNQDIAVIGMSGRFGRTSSIQEYWNDLLKGRDGIRPLPLERRKDIIDFLKFGNDEKIKEPISFLEKAYLDRIDQFDNNLFSLSPMEASTMDPNQRIFLETAWAAIEDAGYGGDKLVGTNTGVYLGFCSIALENYLSMIEKTNHSLVGISAPGNIRSIIASRISYLLDLRGPSIVIDTACSSSLTALHIACQAIRNGECDQAIVGGVKISLIPAQSQELSDSDIGINASNGRTRTFDDNSDGTGAGEGSAAVLLKPLSQALEDRDQIYAVIKGSAINQDGSSVGITAPNSTAQEEVIVKAWENANIDPETISYIEAHGTATKLGDPVEIGGIEGAFRRFTNKKQFCAIGSVKTNIGHLDAAAGIAGLIKAILILKSGIIPPNLHFSVPNRNINFINSPVYINDCLREIEKKDFPRRCGVSSFGLSGTNCHVVLEEAPIVRKETYPTEDEVLALSSKSLSGLKQLIYNYSLFLEEKRDLDLKEVCYTANTGRGHYNHRLIINVKDMEDLRNKINQLENTDILTQEIQGVFYGENKVISKKRFQGKAGEITEFEKQDLSREAEFIIKQWKEYYDKESLNYLCQLYIRGADINWKLKYSGIKVNKISVPSYPFEKKRCWIQRQQQNLMRVNNKNVKHPLLDKLVIRSKDTEIYTTNFSTSSHWEINEHKLHDHHLMPGTAFIEMAREVGKTHYQSQDIELKNILFSNPLMIEEGELKEVHTHVKVKDNHLEFYIFSSKADGYEYETHAEGSIYRNNKSIEEKHDIQGIIRNCDKHIIVNYDDYTEGRISVGPRWKNTRKLHIGNDEMLVELDLEVEFSTELEKYYLYPSLLDGAVNAANALMNDTLFLPFHYEGIRIVKPIPAKFYSYIKRRKQIDSSEIAKFDIKLINENGEVFGEIENYCIKNATNIYKKVRNNSNLNKLYHKVEWVPSLNQLNQLKELKELKSSGGKILVFKDSNIMSEEIIRTLDSVGMKVIEIELGKHYEQINDQKYRISINELDFEYLKKDLHEEEITHCLFLWSLDNQEIYNENQLQEQINRGINTLFYLIKFIVQIKNKESIQLTIITNHAYSITGDETSIHPHYASIHGLCKAVRYEYPHICIKGVDIDRQVSVEQIAQELTGNQQEFLVAYRDGVRYIEEISTHQLENYSNQEVIIKERGVYIITGGTGGIGLEIGKYLSTQNNITLILMNRSSFPVREEWHDILTSSKDIKLINKIKKIQEIESLGSSVNLVQCDVSRKEELEINLQGIHEKYGKINGIIHSAGVAGEGFILFKDKQIFDEVFMPKVHGTWLLHDLTKQEELDFFIMFSSLTSIFGAPGQSDYTAANAYLDSFADYRRRKGKPATTINWCGWNETGMAVEYGGNNVKGLFKTISSLDGSNSFADILQKDISRILVGEIDMDVLKESLSYVPIKLSDEQKENMEKTDLLQMTNPTPEEIKDIIIVGKDQKVLTETEKRVSYIWANVLGVNELDVYDKFFEIGGDSLLATYLIKELNKKFPNVIDITDVFLYPTICEMASFIDDKLYQNNKVEVKEENKEIAIDEILEKLTSGEIEVNKASELLNSASENK